MNSPTTLPIPYLPTQKTSLPIDILVVEKKYNAKYVGDFCLKGRDGQWVNQPAAIFWQETPPIEGYSNYFGIVVKYNYDGKDPQIFITSGESAFASPIVGKVADNGEVVYSRYRHDYRNSADGSVAVDGGRDYTKVVGNIHNDTVHIVVDGPTLKIVPVVNEVTNDQTNQS